MTFGADHYVPVLKIKRGEKAALLAVAPRLRPRITPLLEIVERRPDPAKSLEQHLDTSFKLLADSVRPYARCFLDAVEIASDGDLGASSVFQRATDEGIAFAPVTGISRSADTAAALAHRTHGLAIRLIRKEFEAGGLSERLRSYLGQHQLEPEQTDLIVDLGALDDLVTPGVIALTQAFLGQIPEHPRWRSLTVSACAFPSSMGRVPRRGHAFFERDDWLAWRTGLHARRHELARLPTYSDCAIQHSKGVEGFDPRTMQASAAVRYAVPDSWLLIKGEGTRVTPPSVQFPELAAQLVSGELRPHFAGADHCEGCRSIEAAAAGATGLGSLEAWRRLGTIHHITTVADALGSLPGA